MARQTKSTFSQSEVLKIRLINLKGNVWDLAGAFDVQKSLKRY